MSDNKNMNKNETLEITIGDLLHFLRKYFLLLIIAPGVFAVVGIIYSFSLPKLFTAQTVLLPEYSMGGNNSFFSMAVTADRGGAEKLVPELYPNILTSTPFGQFLLKQPVTDITGKKYTDLKQYLSRDTTQSMLARLFAFLRPSSGPSSAPVKVSNSNIIFLSKEEQGKISAATGLVNITVDDKNGIITIGCEMEDPMVAAMLVEYGKNYLVQYVEDYRTSKTSNQAAFLQERVTEAKTRQQNAEYALQSYRDRNRNSFLNVARIEEQRLQADYTLAQSIYSDLVVKLEQSKIKVKEERPVFKILEPAKVPINKSSPKRLIIAFVFALAGGFATLVYIIFFREKYHLKLM